MRVVNTQPFALIYSISEHQHFGYVIEPYVVQINTLGNLTLSNQKLFSSNIDYYSKQIDADDEALIAILEHIDQEKLIKRYTKKGMIRAADYFKKEFDPDFNKKFIRPFIEKKLIEAMPLLAKKHLFLTGKDNNPAWRALQIAEKSASVLFHFRRDEEGTNYFPTIKYEGEKIDFKASDAILLTNQPAWLLFDSVLYSFEKKVDGNKLKPFLSKMFIRIPKSAEPKYYETFILPLIEKFDVYAQGFEIVSDNLSFQAVLILDDSWGDEIRLNLYFEYLNKLYPYHSNKRISVYLEREGDNYRFIRIRRNKQAEELCKVFLEFEGLKIHQGSSFIVDTSKFSGNMLEWLAAKGELLHKKNTQLRQPGNKKYSLAKPEIRFEIGANLDWFDVNIKIRFGIYELTFAEIKKYIKSGQESFELPNGDYATIPQEWFASLNELFELSEANDSLKLPASHWSLLESIEFAEKDDSLKERLELLQGSSFQKHALPEKYFKAQLRPYQIEGFQWLSILKQNNFGGCLADDMGLGKTVQAMAILAKEKEGREQKNESEWETPENNQALTTPKQISLFDQMSEPLKPKRTSNNISLIVAPTSLVYNWVNEFEKFTNGLNYLIHMGVNRGRDRSYFNNYDVVITTYGILRSKISFFANVPFHYVILDESQAIKNPVSQTSKAVNSLLAKHKIVLTGTPVENSITDLWSQMNFINPGLLGSFSYFQKNYVIPIEKEFNKEKEAKLKKLIQPFVMRRTKDQVAADLPDKYELIHYCEMTEAQESKYDEVKSAYRNSLLKIIDEIGINKSKLHILKGLIALRQLANHPALCFADYDGNSGKFTEITRMLETAIQEGHKVLLFSQFVKHLRLFENYLNANKIPYCYIDGSVKGKDRMDEVNRFNTDAAVPVFLISLKAGGTGLNLTSADYVFLADPWWNPAVERQAIDRAHRIGQIRKVMSYKFITKNSIEEKILKLQEKKQQLANDIIAMNENWFSQLDLADMESLLS